DRIDVDKGRYRYPLGLCFISTVFYSLCVVMMYIVTRVARSGAAGGNVHHPRFGKVLLGITPAIYMMLLFAIALFQRVELGAFPWMTFVSVTWIVLLVCNVAIG